MAGSSITIYAGETRFLEGWLRSDMDPLDDTVRAAVVPHNTDPKDSDWKAANWLPSQTWVSNLVPVVAHVLVGPGGVLQLGSQVLYDVVFRIGDTPEDPWIPVGTVFVR